MRAELSASSGPARAHPRPLEGCGLRSGRRSVSVSENRAGARAGVAGEGQGRRPRAWPGGRGSGSAGEIGLGGGPRAGVRGQGSESGMEGPAGAAAEAGAGSEAERSGRLPARPRWPSGGSCRPSIARPQPRGQGAALRSRPVPAATRRRSPGPTRQPSPAARRPLSSQATDSPREAARVAAGAGQAPGLRVSRPLGPKAAPEFGVEGCTPVPSSGEEGVHNPAALLQTTKPSIFPFWPRLYVLSQTEGVQDLSSF